MLVAAVAVALSQIPLVVIPLVLALFPATLVVVQLPELAESASGGLEQVEDFLADDPLGIGLTGVADIVDAVGEQLGEIGELAPQALKAAVVAFEFVAGLLILLVVLLFYLKAGRRLTEGVLSVVPSRFRGRTRAVASRAWDTLGAFFRGQLLVALVDAVTSGILGAFLAVPVAAVIAETVDYLRSDEPPAPPPDQEPEDAASAPEGTDSDT